MTSLLELFRTLSSFAPRHVNLSQAPWEAYTTWAIGQGLAPLAAYNLEYRLGASGAPEWARDRLLSIYQGSANDNVMKLVNFKRSVDELVGRKVIVLGSASFVESLYPHVAFRPVIDFRLFVPPQDLDGFANYMKRADFKVDAAASDTTRPERILTDTRSLIFVHTQLAPTPEFDAQLRERAVPMKVYGPSMYRLELEDALLVHLVLLARAGFEVPMIEFVDVRELVLEAPSLGAVYSRPIDVAAFTSRVAAWGAERAAYAGLSIVERLFPETSAAIARLKPTLNFAVREIIDRAVVAPVCDVGQEQTVRGVDRLRALLSGG